VILSSGRTLEVPLADLAWAVRHADSYDDVTTLAGVERAHIERVLEKTRWVLGGPRGAAVRLGVQRTTLQSLMRRLGISRPAAVSLRHPVSAVADRMSA